MSTLIYNAPQKAIQYADSIDYLYCSSKFVFYPYARHAIYDALRALGIKSGDKVLLPDYICRDVLSSVQAIGAKPSFYSVERSLCARLPFPKDSHIKAVLAVNYFGFPQELAPFREYCETSGATLIEDNAHGFLGETASGELLGTRGDIGIFSFRKTIPMPSGAGLLINNAKYEFLNDRLTKNWGNDGISNSFKLKQSLRKLVPVIGGRPIIYATMGLRAFKKLTTGNEVPVSDSNSEYNLPPWHGTKEFILKSFSQINFSSEVERRRHLYKTCEQILSGLPINPIFNQLPKGCSPQVFPFFCKRDDIHAIKSVLYKHGLECYQWPDLPEAVKKNTADFYYQSWGVRFLW